MTPLYFYLLVGSLSVPLLFSVFVIDFVKKLKNFLISTSIVALVFLVWDVIFTENGVWGFEEKYCLGIHILKMPIEEWLFFFIIPFCSLFTHFAFFYKFPKVKLPRNFTRLFTVGLKLLCLYLVFSNAHKAYTSVNYSFLFVVLAIGLFFNIELLQKFYISFLIILVPFFLVNGALTGMFTNIPVVWYDNTENLGIRLISIPIEDIGYAFSMLFGNLFLFEKLNAFNK
ncbi:lycopene cyclase domain-containing protein [Flavicella sp.]|uniref:lycopene cyclase domain-containing protein n=1 Tax=Flavicella sp. TaxID=2957742 RepID=UPI002639648C|nr:lycopene cyclase domain-containing protein [Flavicella sp.]MDG1805546.1 lycopene cyclase domain-containing protein [Flavicella sp.]MDG2280544.1 lycopene cyclase domain-containing protein [Flavicella sp.]